MYTNITPYSCTRNNRSFLAPLFDDRIFRSLFDLGDSLPAGGFRVDVKDGPEAYTLTAELPGVKPEAIQLSAEQDVLTIEADMNTERKEEREHYVYTERRSGHLRRSFSLEGIDQEHISAGYENGVLTVTLPKLAPEAPKGVRRIAIDGVPAPETNG